MDCLKESICKQHKEEEEELLEGKVGQEVAGDVHPRAASNRWKLATGGRPSKVAVRDMLRHQTTVLQPIGKLHAVIVKSWAPWGAMRSRQISIRIIMFHWQRKSQTPRMIIILLGNEEATWGHERAIKQLRGNQVTHHRKTEPTGHSWLIFCCRYTLPKCLFVSFSKLIGSWLMYSKRMQSNSRPLQSETSIKDSFLFCSFRVLDWITKFCQVRRKNKKRTESQCDRFISALMTGLSWRETETNITSEPPPPVLLQTCTHHKDSVSSPSLYWSVLGEIPFYYCPSAADCSCQCWVIWWYICVFLQWKNSIIVNTCTSGEAEGSALERSRIKMKSGEHRAQVKSI